MKIQKFNEIFRVHPIELNYNDSKYPIKCKFKNRTPNPGVCYITEINFEERKFHWSNGFVSSNANFDDVEFLPDLFSYNKYNI